MPNRACRQPAEHHEGHARSRLPGHQRHVVRGGQVRQLARYLDTARYRRTSSIPAAIFNCGRRASRGTTRTNLYRNKLAKYFLPSINEWHKAAYYDPVAGVYYTYPTGINNVPDGIDFVGDPNFDAVFYDGGLNLNPNAITNVGLPSPYGTFGQGGNVDEWAETAFDRTNDDPAESRGRLGGSWVDGSTLLLGSNPNGIAPFVERPYSGFRVTSIVPEPNVSIVLVTGVLLLIVCDLNRCSAFAVRNRCGKWRH